MENFKINYFVLLFFLLLYSCQQSPIETSENKSENILTSSSILLEFEYPQNGTVVKYGDTIEFSCKNHKFSEYDSLKVEINQTPYNLLNIKDGKLQLSTDNIKAGTNQIAINIKGKNKMHGQTSVVIIAAKSPKEYRYKVIKAYPHYDNSFTQGLEYYDGYIYEGSGQYGESKLFKYKLETGEIIQSYNLANNVFGEGIVIYNQYIYQLTWQSNIAYKYDLKTFKLLQTFEFYTEGWGLTKHNNMLIMSDGSNRLYYLDPETFKEISRLEIYNNIGPVTYLNELEYIDGYIYANVFETNNIVIINPKNGFVEGIIKLNNLLNMSKVKRKPDVLNGIAYDVEKKRILVTGKYWPEIYHIEIIPNM